jgi:hypothetical protein
MKEDGSPKDRHVSWLASRGLGKSETAIRILCYLATRDDSLAGSEMMLVTGNGQYLANDLCKRIKHLPLFKGCLDNTATNIVELNGVHIEAYPASGHSSSTRGKSLVSAIFLDEASWFGTGNDSNQQEILDSLAGYWVKSNPYTLIASSPFAPGDLMDRIFNEEELETAWRRLKMDWRYGENLIYTQADLARIRQTSSYGREMELRFSYSGGSFLPSQIERAISNEYSNDYIPGTTSIAGVDCGFSTSAFGICICSLIDGKICVYYSNEIQEAVAEDMISLLLDLKYQYNISHFYIDAASPGFIRSLLLAMNLDPNVHDVIDRAHKAHIDPGLWTSVLPIAFGTMHKQLLQNVKFLLSDDLVSISSKHDKLIQSLYNASDIENSLIKPSVHDHVLDAFRLSLQGFEVSR